MLIFLSDKKFILLKCAHTFFLHILPFPSNVFFMRYSKMRIKIGGWKHVLQMSVALCHGPAGVPRLATRCLCLLSTWLVCLVPCAPMSIVCPLPSCYLIIVSVAPAVSPSLPSFVSLYSSPCVCSPVLIRCLSCVVRYVSVSCLTVPQSSACLLVFPLRGGFCSLFCLTLLLKDLSSAFESSTSFLVTHCFTGIHSFSTVAS